MKERNDMKGTDKKKLSQKQFWSMLSIITILGLILRIICCYWGYPYQLHPDEQTIVTNAIDMISRHSWEAYVYNRPDQFEIKCCAVIFQIFSYVKYGVSASDVFFSHMMDFYTLARFFTTVWGTLLIPLSALFAGALFSKDKLDSKMVSLLTAVIFAFSYLFVQHSAYATPDITLTFFIVAIAYLSLKYINYGERRDIYFISVLTGIAVSIKYPAAIISLYIAFLVIYKSIHKKRYIDVFKIGFVCICIVIGTIFIIAPNLFTDFGTLLSVFKLEMRSTHVGFDNLGILGNLKYYFETIVDALGWISLVCFVFGLIHLFVSRKKEYFPFLINLLFWGCLSALSLHWVRWGFPMYVGYIIISVSGFVWIWELISEKIQVYWKYLICKNIVVILGVISGTSICLSAIALTVWSTKEDTRVWAMDWCRENGVTTENSIFEAYTPLSVITAGSGPQYSSFILTDKGVKVIEEKAGYQYFVMSSSFKDRYFNEPERYEDIVAIYEGIDTTYDKLLQIEGSNLSYSRNELINIMNQITYLLHNDKLTGNTIYVYNLAPDLVSIHPYYNEDNYLSSNQKVSGELITITENRFLWTIYENEESVSLITQSNALAMNVTGAVFNEGTTVDLCDVNENIAQEWRIERESDDGYVFILTENNMALTYFDGRVILTEYQKSNNQKWHILSENDGEDRTN